MLVAVRARAVVSKVLARPDVDGVNMVYEKQGVRQCVGKGDFKDGRDWYKMARAITIRR